MSIAAPLAGPGACAPGSAAICAAARRGAGISDQLTEAGRVLGAWIAPGGDECALVRALAALPVPLDGFGSSDCPRCRAHLLHWPQGAAAAFLGEQKC
jgi:histidyl-tRNA synthetase